MTDFRGLVDHYLKLWNEPDAGARSAGVAALFVEDATYTDPLADVAVGFDVAGVADDGRIRAVYGFLDKVPG